ncbi:MAG: peptidoglycan-associated lipoprotein Pal [Betaproteobacteria bacterium]|nr:peptidoglycan-associated lipoprotein Pal [Betaproteobacteria bacterium]
MNKATCGMLLVGLLAGCAGQDVKDLSQTAIASRTPAAPSSAKSLDQNAIDALALKDPNNILSKRSVYYDFDKSNIKSEFKPLVDAHAKYIANHKEAKATVQGNCDERGSREYNIALGNRRADSVRKTMGVLGVPDSQVEVVSFGEEKPRATCHEESCWHENRRSDIVYRGEQ